MRGNLLDRLIDVSKVRIAIAAAHRCADGQKDEIGLSRRRVKLACKMQPARAHVLCHQSVETGLVDRDLAAAELGELAPILFDAGDVPAEFRKTCGGYQADIAGPDHADVHPRCPLCGN